MRRISPVFLKETSIDPACYVALVSIDSSWPFNTDMPYGLLIFCRLFRRRSLHRCAPE